MHAGRCKDRLGQVVTVTLAALINDDVAMLHTTTLCGGDDPLLVPWRCWLGAAADHACVPTRA